MRAVNTEQEKILKQYKSEGRIMQEPSIQNEFLMQALHSAKNHKNLYMNEIFKSEDSSNSSSEIEPATLSKSLFANSKVNAGTTFNE